MNKLKYTALSLMIIFAYSAVFAAPQDISILIGIAVAISILALNIIRMMPSRLAEERASRERQVRIEQYQEDLLKAQLEDFAKK